MNYNDLIGKPFLDEGRGPDGYDCYGLLAEVYRRHGIVLPPVNISVCACQEAAQALINKHLGNDWIKIDKPEVPSTILIRADIEHAQHLGCYIGSKNMIHVTMNRAVVIDKISDWKKRIKGFYRYVGHNNVS